MQIIMEIIIETCSILFFSFLYYNYKIIKYSNIINFSLHKTLIFIIKYNNHKKVCKKYISLFNTTHMDDWLLLWALSAWWFFTLWANSSCSSSYFFIFFISCCKKHRKGVKRHLMVEICISCTVILIQEELEENDNAK